MLEFLHVVCSESSEYQHRQHVDHEGQCCEVQPDVHYAGDDYADQSHEQERAHGGQVSLGGVAYDGESAEHYGRHEERSDHAVCSVDVQQRSHAESLCCAKSHQHHQEPTIREPLCAKTHDQYERQG